MPSIGASVAASPGLYLPSPTALYQWHRAVANARLNGLAAKVCVFGDSIVDRGVGIGMREALKGAGLLANVVAGPVWTQNSDPQIVAPTGWSFTTAGPAGASVLTNTTTAAGGAVNFTFTADTCDRFAVTVLNDTSADYFSMGIDAEATVRNVASRNSSTRATQTFKVITATVGTHTLKITGREGAIGTRNVVLAVEALNGAEEYARVLSSEARKNHLSVSQLGVAGKATAAFLPSLPIMFPSLATDVEGSGLRLALAIVYLGANDWSSGVPVATYKSNLAQIIDAAKAARTDVALCTQHQSGSREAGEFLNAIAAYDAATYELANEKNVAVVDFARRWPAHSTIKATNDIVLNADGIHPGATGAYDMGAQIASLLLNGR